jgi:hypothetical protein
VDPPVSSAQSLSWGKHRKVTQGVASLTVFPFKWEGHRPTLWELTLPWRGGFRPAAALVAGSGMGST